MKKYISTEEAASKWEISERSVHNYCAGGRVDGALLTGKIWKIPSEAQKPERKNKATPPQPSLIEILKREKAGSLRGGLYHKVQIELTYNSNHIEGNRLTHDQTRYIFETNTIGIEDKSINVDDIIETVNHFRCIDMIIDAAERPLSETMIKRLHMTLKRGTSDERREWFAVGDYKRFPNEVGGMETTPPGAVHDEMTQLLSSYGTSRGKTLEEILDFHRRFERIHPFQDGNGRVGRLILFKECLRCAIIPFIISDDMKYFYYRGLSAWPEQKGYLRDTCLAAQDKFKEYLDYFRCACK